MPFLCFGQKTDLKHREDTDDEPPRLTNTNSNHTTSVPRVEERMKDDKGKKNAKDEKNEQSVQHTATGLTPTTRRSLQARVEKRGSVRIPDDGIDIGGRIVDTDTMEYWTDGYITLKRRRSQIDESIPDLIDRKGCD